MHHTPILRRNTYGESNLSISLLHLKVRLPNEIDSLNFSSILQTAPKCYWCDLSRLYEESEGKFCLVNLKSAQTLLDRDSLKKSNLRQLLQWLLGNSQHCQCCRYSWARNIWQGINLKYVRNWFLVYNILTSFKNGDAMQKVLLWACFWAALSARSSCSIYSRSA